MVICGFCCVKAWMTMRPRASEVMKLGSPVKTSRAAAGVGLEAGVAAEGRDEVGGARGVRLKRIPFRRGDCRCEGDSRTISTINAQAGSPQEAVLLIRRQCVCEKIGNRVLHYRYRLSSGSNKRRSKAMQT